MSGHNKWASIKHKKGANDAKRGKLWSKIAKELAIASKNGGSDPDANSTLRNIITKAKGANMPNDNIDRAIKRGAGELEGVSYEEITYEGYGPGGVAVMVDVTTDNKNRSAAEIRSIFSKNGGEIGKVGCVGWTFDKKALVTVDASKYDEDTLMEAALEAGADDVVEDGGEFSITGEVSVFSDIVDALEAKGIERLSADITRIPKSTVTVEEKDVKKLLRMMDLFEDHDDVQSVSANFDIPDELLEGDEG